MHIHPSSIVVVRLVDEAKPQHPQRFKLVGFLALVRAELVRQPLSIVGVGSGGLTRGGSRKAEVRMQQLRHRWRRKKKSNSGRKATGVPKPHFRIP